MELIDTAHPLAYLFASGEEGFILDPSYADSLFTGTGGTTPASAGQKVALIADASGNGNDFVQADSSKQAVLTGGSGLLWLALTGAEGYQSAADITWGANEATAASSLAQTSDGFQSILKLTANAFSTNYSFSLQVNANARGYASSRGTTTRNVTSAVLGSSPFVLSAVSRVSSALVQLRLNGAAGAASTSTQGTNGNYATARMNLAARDNAASAFLQGSLFFAFAINKVLGTSDLEAVESCAASVAGVTL